VERFTEEEWKKLTYAPFLTFLLVSGADGSIDKKELKAFAKALARQENPLMLELLQSCSQPPQTILAELAQMGEEAANLLNEVGEMLDSKLPENYALAYKYELLQIGKSIAEASGGFLGMGKKISEEENVTLAVIAKLLGLV